MTPNLFFQKDLQCLGLSILGNLSQCLVSDLAHTFSLQVHILTNLCERDVRSSDAIECRAVTPCYLRSAVGRWRRCCLRNDW